MPDSKERIGRHVADNMNNTGTAFSPNVLMAAAPLPSSSARNVPLLGMLLDRTSFDEADDYGVTHEEIKSKMAAFQAPPPTVMKNGKVRRRLRWRQRTTKKPPIQKEQQPLDPQKQQQVTTTSQPDQDLTQQQLLQLSQQSEMQQSSNQQSGDMSSIHDEATTSNLKNEQDRQPERAASNRPPQPPPPPPANGRGRTMQQQRGRGPVGESSHHQRLANRIPLNLNQYGARNGGGSGSSNASVISHISKQSRMSAHSFASTETAAMSNKKKDKVKKFVIRRPNYLPNSSSSPSVDCTNSILSDSSSSSHARTDQGSDMAQHSRFSPTTVGCNPLFAAPFVSVVGVGGTAVLKVDAAKKNEPIENDAKMAGPKCTGAELGAETSPTLPDVLPLPPSRQQQHRNETRDSRSLPPVFKRIHNHYKSRRQDSSGSINLSSLHQVRNDLSGSDSGQLSSQNHRSSPDPILFGEDDVEEDRRVDLRIAPSHLSERSKNSNSNASGISGSLMFLPMKQRVATTFAAVDSQLIEELRSQSFASSTSSRMLPARDNNKVAQQIEQTESPDDNGFEFYEGDDDEQRNDRHEEESEDRDDEGRDDDVTQSQTGEQENDLKTSNSSISNQLLSLPIALKTAMHDSIISLRSTKSNISNYNHKNKPTSPRRSSSFQLESSETNSAEFRKNMDYPKEHLLRRPSESTVSSSKATPTDELRFSMSSSRHNFPSSTVQVNKQSSESKESSLVTTPSQQPLALATSTSTSARGDRSVGAESGMDIPPKSSKNVTGVTNAPKVSCEDIAFLEAEKNLQAIQEVATEHLQQGEYSEALEVFQEILRGLLTRYGEEHPRVGTAVHNIGVVHMRRGDYNKALVAYKEAVRVRKLVLEADHPDIAVSLAQLGMAYLEVDKHQRAIGAFREALKIRRKCFGNYHPKVAKVLNNIGCALYELDELDVARVAFEEALDIQRRILSTNLIDGDKADNEATLLSIASTQSNIASIKLYFGEFDAAVVDLEEALLMQQSVLGDNHIISQRTQESLVWLEAQRQKQLQELAAANKGNDPPYGTITTHGGKKSGILGIIGKKATDDGTPRDAKSRTRDILNKLTRTTSPIKTTMRDEPTTALVTENESLGNGVFGTLERSLRKFHADLDYMSCGGG